MTKLGQKRTTPMRRTIKIDAPNSDRKAFLRKTVVLVMYALSVIQSHLSRDQSMVLGEIILFGLDYYNGLCYSKMEGNFNEYVTVKCNKCGKEYGFPPMRVICLRDCDCGNNNWGSPRGWWNDDFGNFTLVRREEWYPEASLKIGLQHFWSS